jgi:hypothetical protein
MKNFITAAGKKTGGIRLETHHRRFHGRRGAEGGEGRGKTDHLKN